ncbi:MULTISPECIES: DUF1508 domain-containing protein [Rhodococcus]|uniref:DUF1508 domain-containing protein n=1 Tax=Rhodococcus pyridinivorans TaxID=103816 RepID=A0A7M2XJV7_9NOCA|nr:MULTISPECIES: DUF1508 domain-containing protein [Rhodococcus]QOV97622.1 DUF1508 domain-containing protein [Rhodococcus pyridinivorans]
MTTPSLHTVRLYIARDGFRWHRKAANGRIVSESGEAYTTKGAALEGLSMSNRDTDNYTFIDDTEEPQP